MKTGTRGAWAERLALAELERSGLQLIEQNYRERFGELDIIMSEQQKLVFVEVRYRASDRWGDGLASVTKAKQRRLVNAARSYLKRHREFYQRPCRFDVVAVSGSNDDPQIRWVRNAFDAG